MFLTASRLLIAFLATAPLQAIATRHYDIINNCPLAVNYYINGMKQGSLAPYRAGHATRRFPDNWSGFIYSDFNGGNGADGSGTVRAGFYGESNYYYIVTDPNHLNIGVGIVPKNQSESNSFCAAATCEVDNCPISFTSPPTRFSPPVPGKAPKPPLYECPHPGTGYTVTFCPKGTIPNYKPHKYSMIHPVVSTTKCMDVRGAKFANGTPVQIYDCNGSQAQKFNIIRGGQHIKVAGTNFCLDAGSHPASGIGLKIWQCYDNLPAQQWTYTSDNRIILTNRGQCIDLTDGSLKNSNQLQTWACTNNNKNQIWV